MQNILLSTFFSCAIVLPFFIAHLLNARRIERDSEIWDKNKGHVVTAVLRKKEHRHHDTSKVGVYEYEHEGKTYRYHLWQNYLPGTITLYFARNPKKADTEPELYAQKKPLAYWLFKAAVIAFIFYLAELSRSIMQF